MSSVQIDQKSYEMPPKEGISIACFLTVADLERSARWYEKVFGARILTMGDGNAPPYLQLANIWMILNVGGGPTPDKPTVTLSVPDPNHINSFMNFRVADIQACYELWKSRGAEFLTPPIPKYGEIRCYIRDPDGYIIEVGQSTDLLTVDARLTPGPDGMRVAKTMGASRSFAHVTMHAFSEARRLRLPRDIKSWNPRFRKARNLGYPACPSTKPYSHSMVPGGFEVMS